MATITLTIFFSMIFLGSFTQSISWNARSSRSFIETLTTARPVIESVNYYASPSKKIITYSDFHGLDFNHVTGNANVSVFGSLYGIESTVRHNTIDSMRHAVPLYAHVQNITTGRIAGVKGLRILTENKTTGTINSVYNIFSEDAINNGGVIENMYGIWIDSMRAGTIKNYGVYSLSAKNYFKSVTVGSVTTAQKLAIINPDKGQEVFDSDLNQKSYWNGTVWINY